MSTPYIGEVKIISWNFAPNGWAFCNGQLLAINQNQALFAILGTFYGGNGTTNFALPNLQGCSPVHVGTGADGQVINLGQSGGEASHTLVIGEIPTHTHTPLGSSATPSGGPAGNLWAPHSSADYALTQNIQMNGACLANTGGSQPHQNMSPYLVLNFIIALSGIFPSRN